MGSAPCGRVARVAIPRRSWPAWSLSSCRSPRAVATWLETAAPDTLAVCTPPQRDVRRRLATTNSIEHDHLAVRRHTSVVRVLPNEAGFLRLASALAMERNDQWLSRRHFVPQPTHDAEALMPAA